MAERVQIVLEAQDVATGVLRGIVSHLGSLGSVMSDLGDVVSKNSALFSLYQRGLTDASVSIEQVRNAEMQAQAATARLAETLATVVIQVLKDSYKAYTELAGAVRDLALVSGTSAEDASRFVQVLDDFELSAEDAMTAARALKENGLAPNIETLAQLADEYKRINDPAEKMEFIQQNLGRSGAKWVNILNQESDALRERAAQVDKNLILDDKQIRLHEVQRLALDDVSDKWEGFKVQLGQNVGNVIAYNEASKTAIERLREQGVFINSTTYGTQAYRDELKKAMEEQLAAAQTSLDLGDSLKEQELAAEAAAEALKALSAANADTINSAIQITEENAKYQESQDDILNQIAELQAEKDGYYSWEISKIQETQEKIDDLSAKYDENAEAFREAQEKKLAMMAIEKIALLDGVEGYSNAEYEMAKAVLERTDVATAAAFDQQQAMEMLSSAVANGQINIEQFGAIMDQVMADGIVSVNEVTDAINAIPSGKTFTLSVVTSGDTGLVGISNGQRVERRAGGGTVGAGNPYIVGEHGAELFVPQSNGTIVPNNRMGGNEAISGMADRIVAAIFATRIDEARLAVLIKENGLQGAR